MDAAHTNLIETAEVAELLGKPGVKILFSAFNPGKVEEVATLFKSGHLPGAFLFNPDVIRDTSSPYPVMLPSAEEFATHLKALGVARTD